MIAALSPWWGRLPWLAALGLGLLFLVTDLLLPLGSADGVLQVAVVLAGWWMPAPRRAIPLLAGTGTLLVVAGFLLSPDGGEIPLWVILLNRGYALFAIWCTAVILLVARNAMARQEQLAQALQIKENRFRKLFDTMTSGVAVYEPWNDGEDFIIREFNRTGAMISKTENRDVVGMKVTEAFPGVRDFGLFAVFQQVHRTGQSATHPVRYYQDEWHQGWLENHVYRLDTGEIIAIYNDLTEKMLAEKHLRLARHALENSRDMVFWILESGQIFWVNRSACQRLGYAKEELLTKYPWDLNPAHPHELWPAHWQELKTKPGLMFEATLLARDGSPVEVEISTNYMEFEQQAYNLAIVRDIRERKHAEAIIRRYGAIVSASDDHMAFLDRSYVYRAVNRAYLASHGRRYEEIVDHSVRDLFGTEVFERIRENLDLCLGGEAVNYQAWFDFPVSGRRFMDVSYFPHHEDGRVTGVIVVSRDTTERKQMEDKLRVSEEAARQANKAKGEFLANMSHEIRTPMNAILGMCHLALQSDPGERQRHCLHRIETAANSLLRIINDILDFSKIDAGRLELEEAPFDLHRLLDRILEEMQVKAAGKPEGVVIGMNIAAGVPRVVVGDGLRLGQVLTNLCDNAVKFTHRGEVEVTVESMALEAQSVALRFAVRDTGIGISQEQLQLLFQPFQQADTSTTRRYGGSGLGLVICRDLVTLMGGEIHLESTPGVGSRFECQIRFRLAAPEEAARLPQEAADAREEVDLAGRRVLLVDDLADNLEWMRTLLEKRGLSITMAGNGQEAVAAVQAALAPFDCVFMDVQMPEMDGHEATRAIRALPNGREVPIIALTASAMRQDVEACLAAGMNDHLAKPVAFGQLFAKLAQWCQRAGVGGLEIAGGIARCEGDEGLYRRFVANFVAEYRNGADALRQAVADPAGVEALQATHKLKGMAANIEARELSAAACGLNQALTHKDAEAIRVWLPRLIASLERTLKEGDAYLARGVAPASGVAAESAGKEEWLRRIGEFETMLERRDLGCDARFAELRDALAVLPGSADALEALRVALEALDVQGGREALQALFRLVVGHDE
ncbi:MAG: PAS domain S-box protein [Magnetococcales bacterium]|nr:PAS domain S-box protein [Magnetococcales bacterium]